MPTNTKKTPKVILWLRIFDVGELKFTSENKIFPHAVFFFIIFKKNRHMRISPCMYKNIIFYFLHAYKDIIFAYMSLKLYTRIFVELFCAQTKNQTF